MRVCQGGAPRDRWSASTVNPCPDAQERLRRLFLILLKLADDEMPGADPLPDDGGEEEG